MSKLQRKTLDNITVDQKRSHLKKQVIDIEITDAKISDKTADAKISDKTADVNTNNKTADAKISDKTADADTSGKDKPIIGDKANLADQQHKFDDINSYAELIDSTMSKIIRLCNKLQLSDGSINTVLVGSDLIKKGATLLYTIKSHVKTLETILTDCNDFIDDIKEDLSSDRKEEDYVYMTPNGMMSYKGREFIQLSDDLVGSIANHNLKNLSVDNLKNLSANNLKNPSANNLKNNIDCSIKKITIPEIGYGMKFPVVTNINQIPPALYYLLDEGSDCVVNTGQEIKSVKSAVQESKTNAQSIKSNKSGIYINLGNSNYAKVPFPEIVDSTREHDRKHSIRCKYSTKKECDDQRYKMSKYHNTNIRTCNFAHAGDKIVKIGYPSRCPSVPNYGNPKTMSHDVKDINIDDTKHLLLYGLNDVISSMIWLEYKGQKNNIFDRLEIV
jgi:hypothetical protein